MKKIILTVLTFGIGLLSAEEPVLAETDTPSPSPAVDVAKMSEAFGHLLGKNLESMGMRFDIAKVIQGLKDSYEGKTAPMTEAECVQAITAAQEAVFKEAASQNLKKAEEFLTANQKVNGITTLEEGKLQYRVVQEGKGAPVDEESSPLIRYTGKFLDGSVFGASKEEEMIHLDETIPGFGKGLLGMKEGEKRTLFIHPDLGYGTHGDLPPNSLLTFEVEVVKANAPHVESFDALTTPKSKGNPEIASPFEEPAVIR
jgi:peptidylprolyl isomerase